MSAGAAVYLFNFIRRNTVENSNLGNHAFIEKTKKQAKRLLKLAQSKESTLKITTLASAQEILAQINGYPHWHAFESTISKQPILNVFEKSHVGNEKQEINNIIDGVNYLIQDNKLVSVFEVINLPYTEMKEFMSDVEHLKGKCALQFNMGFHEVNLIISHRNRESSQNDYNFYSLSNSLGLEESLVKKLFTLNVSIEKKSKFFLSALIVIKTDSQMASEHADFCANFKKESHENVEKFLLRDYLTGEEKSLLNHDEEKMQQRVSINNEYDLTLEKIVGMKDGVNYSNKEILHKAWIHSINLLSKKNFEWDIEVNLNKNTFTFYQLKENKNNEVYLAGLYKSLNINNDIIAPKMFDFESKKSNGLPWKKGIPFINHTDSEVSYYENGSGHQTSHQTLIYAKPGSGKSLLLSVLNLFSLGDKVSELPYIGTIDIGPASKGVISFLKEILPAEKKHLVQYYRLRMTREYYVNVFDTPLGCRFPSVEQRAFLTNFLALMTMDAGKRAVEDGLISLIGTIIEDMYTQTSERGSPKKYDKGVDLKVDQCLVKESMKIDERTTWWDVVDYLFEIGYIYEATLAQRYAVPVLSDASSSAQTDKIRDIYSKVTVGTGETLLQYFNRSIIDALNQYKNLGQPTLFDLGETRIVSLDLDEVCRSGGYQAEKQTAIMYMLARHLIQKDYKENYETLVDIPYPAHLVTPDRVPALKYKEYHQARISNVANLRKIVCFDEFHRVSNNSLVENQIIVDMREARKWGQEIIIATQSLGSIAYAMKSFITSLFIMDSGNQRDLEEVFETFGINNPEEKKMISNHVHGPRSGKPGVMFARFITTQGTISKLLSFQPTPHLLVMINTAREDMKVKEKLFNRFGLEKTLDILVKEYPRGIKYEVEKEFQYPYPENISDIIFERLLKKYN